MSKMSMGDRLKDFYENRTKTYLPRRTNAMIRLDGVAFSTFTKGLHKPYDVLFMAAMDSTAAYLCQNIQGAKCAFVQSDEISILITDYDTNDTAAWYNYSVQKMCSVAAAMATAHFNRVFTHSKKNVPGFFDARAFSIAFAEEVVNTFIWRQQDCTRNSIATVAQTLYSDKEIHGIKSGRELENDELPVDGMQELIFQRREKLRSIMNANGSLSPELLEKESLNWNDLPAGMKRGRLVTRKVILKEGVNKLTNEVVYARRHAWTAEGAPIFTQNRDAIRQWMPGMDSWNQRLGLEGTADASTETVIDTETQGLK